jgi:hypothetical protein
MKITPDQMFESNPIFPPGISREACKAFMEVYAKHRVIEELKSHVEHPTKPGYKRHDIVKRIKELER